MDSQPPPWNAVDGPKGGGFAEFHRVLTGDLVPSCEQPWYEVAEFALSFDGYSAVGVDKCGRLANRARRQYERDGRVPEPLLDLRVCLFFEQRRGHHTGVEEVGPYMCALLEAIRAVARRDGL
jgi:hypothetical protein